MNFADRLIESILAQKSYLCVGLDPQIRYIPEHVRKEAVMNCDGGGFEATALALYYYFRTIIDATAAYAACYKPQVAFYEKYGAPGFGILESIRDYIQLLGFPVILDAKREDGGDTSQAYADAYLGNVEILDNDGEIMVVPSIMEMDAITVTSWIDTPNFEPFLEACKENGKGIFVVDKTSFKPASRLQEFVVEGSGGKKAWMVLAEFAKEMGKDIKGERGYSSVGVVMGATFPEEAAVMKDIYPDCIKLVPGFKAQGGTADAAVVSVNKDGFGLVANSSRGTNYAYHAVSKSSYQCDPRFFAKAVAEETKEERDALNASVKKLNGRLPWE